MKKQLILASGSPRRKQILKNAGMQFRVFIPHSSEVFDENLTLSEALKKISRLKARTCLNALSLRNPIPTLILAADTVVVVKGRVLGKPKSRSDALRMLRLLSDSTHQVKTSFTLLEAVYNARRCKWRSGRTKSRVITTHVTFRRLTDQDLASYLDSGEPFDKAGAYAIQGKARKFVLNVRGDFLNVVGLPVSIVEEEIRKLSRHEYSGRSAKSFGQDRGR